MADEKDVREVEPSPTAEVTTAAETSTQDPPGGEGADRPLKNVQAEFNRKLQKMQQETNSRLDQLAQLLIAQQQPQVAAPTAQPGVLTDEDLWGKAQMGDRLAFEEYQRRIARREVQQDRTVANRAQIVQGQMQALVQKYPVLNDGSHPLTQTAQAAYQLLVRNGYPATAETLLEAAKTAIADRPDLVSDLYSQGAQAREGARRSATQAAGTGQTGSSVRQVPAQPRNAVIVRPGEAELARRMGIKDPQKAKERFLQRQEKGQSALGAVSGFVKEEDF